MCEQLGPSSNAYPIVFGSGKLATSGDKPESFGVVHLVAVHPVYETNTDQFWVPGAIFLFYLFLFLFGGERAKHKATRRQFGCLILGSRRMASESRVYGNKQDAPRYPRVGCDN